MGRRAMLLCVSVVSAGATGHCPGAMSGKGDSLENEVVAYEARCKTATSIAPKGVKKAASSSPASSSQRISTLRRIRPQEIQDGDVGPSTLTPRSKASINSINCRMRCRTSAVVLRFQRSSNSFIARRYSSREIKMLPLLLTTKYQTQRKAVWLSVT